MPMAENIQKGRSGQKDTNEQKDIHGQKDINGQKNIDEQRDTNKRKATNEQKDTDRRKKSKKKRAGICALLVAAVLVTAFLAFSLPYYHMDMDSPDAPALTPDDSVRVQQEGYYTFYDGPGQEAAMIFYPGAKIDTLAYQDLMMQTASRGTDCFLVDMPLHLAIFGKNRADGIMKNYSYDTWIMSGHSLGGVMASAFAADHQDQIKGLVFLASYTTKDFSGNPDLKALSIYGSQDKVLKMDSYEKAKANLAEGNLTEKVIEGGNHAGFAWYGPQKGDGEAEIGKEEQITETADDIEAFADELAG